MTETPSTVQPVPGSETRSALGLVRARPIRAMQVIAACRSLLGGATGYLNTTGWFRSMVESSPMDAAGEPIPWITYSCLRFLESRLPPDTAVFEFGAGSSTSWWAKRSRRVISCEHDPAWFAKVRATVPANVELMHASREQDEYCRQILRYRGEFDVVVIDGRDRVKCARNSLGALTHTGVILWDNTDREHYRPGFEFLGEHGFRRVDFAGMSPLVMFETCTSVFYRNGNCLGL